MWTRRRQNVLKEARVRSGFEAVFGCQDLRTIIFGHLLSLNKLHTHVHAAQDIARFAVACCPREASHAAIDKQAIKDMWRILAANCPSLHPLITPGALLAIAQLEGVELESILGVLLHHQGPWPSKCVESLRAEAHRLVSLTQAGVPLELIAQVRRLQKRMVAPMNATRMYALSLRELRPITSSLRIGTLIKPAMCISRQPRRCAIPACRLLDVINVARQKHQSVKDLPDSPKQLAGSREEDDFFVQFVLTLDTSNCMIEELDPDEVVCNDGTWFDWEDAVELAKLRACHLWRAEYQLRSLKQAKEHPDMPPPLQAWLTKNWSAYANTSCRRTLPRRASQ